MLYLVLSRYWYRTIILTYSATSPLKSTLGNGQNFLAKLLSKSNNPYGSGRIFALPLTQKKDRFRFPGWGCRSRITIFEVSKIRCIYHYSHESSGPKLYVSNRLFQGLTELVISAMQGHRFGYGEPIGSWEIFFWQHLHLNRIPMYWPCFS